MSGIKQKKLKKEAREKAEYERRKKAEAEAEAEARKKEPKVKNPVNKLINDLGMEARALNKEPDSPEKFKKLSEMHDKLLELSHQTDATSPFVFAQKVAGEIKYAKDKAKEPESQGSGEWDEKEHPRNPDGSFKKK